MEERERKGKRERNKDERVEGESERDEGRYGPRLIPGKFSFLGHARKEEVTMVLRKKG